MRAEPPRVVNPGTPAPDCAFHVNYDRAMPTCRATGPGAGCIPFMPLNQLIPEGQGPEFYVAGFSDAAIRRRWPACKADPACHAAALAGAKPFIAYEGSTRPSPVSFVPSNTSSAAATRMAAVSVARNGCPAYLAAS